MHSTTQVIPDPADSTVRSVSGSRGDHDESPAELAPAAADGTPPDDGDLDLAGALDGLRDPGQGRDFRW